MYFKALDRESQMVSERHLALTIHSYINFTNIYHVVELICFRLIWNLQKMWENGTTDSQARVP